ncbi:MAG: DNA topoisomerase IV subunit A, partial [Sulfuricellaceae bacterium]|nr:DNA topoisomerase IV subunit A [Sulfuricellaceae bacterium]
MKDEIDDVTPDLFEDGDALPDAETGISAPPPEPPQQPDSGDEMPDDPLAQYAKTAYLAYALAVSKSRAIPDVRDGQKPVQRRILYAMR